MAMRKSKGRQKVEMVRMTKDSNRQVTFSKRRTGLFKKASELCTLCGADVAIVVFSPGNKVFSFGHPSVDSVVDRYFSRNTAPSQNSSTLQLIEAHRNATVQELNAELTQVGNQLEKEKKRGEYLANMMKAERRGCWWENPVDQLEKPQLEQLKAGLENLKKKVAKQADKILSSGNAAQLFGRPGIGNMNLMKTNSGFYPSQTDPDEFEQKNILGGPLVPAAAPVMNMNMNMNNLNMALMTTMMPPPPPGYNNLEGAQFNSFGRGFF